MLSPSSIVGRYLKSEVYPHPERIRTIADILGAGEMYLITEHYTGLRYAIDHQGNKQQNALSCVNRAVSISDVTGLTVMKALSMLIIKNVKMYKS